MDQSEAVDRMQRGDWSALDTLYNLYAESALRTAYLIVRDKASAEDAVHEAFVQVMRSIGGLRDPGSFRPWFFRILVNSARRMARNRSRFGPLPPDHCNRADPTAPTPVEAAIHSAEIEVLRAALRELQEEHRVLVVLRYFTRLSDLEIAEAVGLPPGTVKSRLHAARRVIQQRLEGSARSADRNVAARVAAAGPISSGAFGPKE